MRISQRKRAEETLKNYAAKLEEVNRLKDLFTGIMLHDLLNLLGVIKIAAEQTLLMETKDERMRNTLHVIKRNADKLIDMIKSASMYSILESSGNFFRFLTCRTQGRHLNYPAHGGFVGL